jgi:hypothetical protein
LNYFDNWVFHDSTSTSTSTMARIELFKKSAGRNTEFERYLVSSEPKPSGSIITLDSTRSYVMTLPLSYFVSKPSAKRTKGKADAMPFESFRIINVQHRGGNAHSLVLIKSRAIKSNPHHIAIFESNGRNGFCGIRILDDHVKPLKNVTKDYTTISPKYNINYGSDKHNPGYCGIYGIICIVALRHYRSKTGTMWLAKWTKLLLHMSQCIDRNAGCLGVELAAQVQEIIATNPSGSCAEKEIVGAIRACLSTKHETICSFVL